MNRDQKKNTIIEFLDNMREKGVHLKNFNLNKVKTFDHFKNNYSAL